MAQSKKADLKFLAGIIIAVVSAIIIIVFVVLPVTTGISADSGDRFCGLNSALKGAMPVGSKRLVSLPLCHERTVRVAANNWKECDSDGARGWKSSDDRESCAAYQLAKLGKRCFVMYGENTRDLSVLDEKYPCFKARVVNLVPSGTEIDEITFTKGMGILGYCTNAERFNNYGFKYNGKDCGDWDHVSFYNNVRSGDNKICYEGRDTEDENNPDRVIVNGC